MKEIKIDCSYDGLVKISDIKPHPKNNNRHSKEQIERLAKIIEYQGFRSAIVVSKLSGCITKGHGRLMAAKKLGMKKVPVNFQDYANESQEYADLTADNEIARWAELDMDSLLDNAYLLADLDDLDFLGIKDFDIPDLDDIIGERKEHHDMVTQNEESGKDDEIPEIKDSDPVKTKMGDIWLLGKHRLMCGDSTMIDDVEKLMSGEKADMVFTDPPYGMNVVKKDGKNNQLGNTKDGVVGATARGNYKKIIGDETNQTAINCFNLCQGLDINNQIWWGANFYHSDIPNNHSWIVWDKENGEGFFADGELAWTSNKKQLRIFRHRWKGMIRASEMGEKRVHPTQKPIALAKWCFENYGKPELIMDLFLGSGSTLIACEKTNKKCYGMELDEQYCDVIINRWQNYTGKDAILESTGEKYNEIK